MIIVMIVVIHRFHLPHDTNCMSMKHRHWLMIWFRLEVIWRWCVSSHKVLKFSTLPHMILIAPRSHNTPPETAKCQRPWKNDDNDMTHNDTKNRFWEQMSEIIVMRFKIPLDELQRGDEWPEVLKLWWDVYWFQKISITIGYQKARIRDHLLLAQLLHDQRSRSLARFQRWNHRRPHQPLYFQSFQ
jgi:hypothetical protein